MLYLLALGRDMNETGTKTGPQVERILAEALAVCRRYLNDVTIVVAPGFSPDFPDEPRSYAAMMADWLREHGCQHVVVLEAESFDTDGEIRAFREFCRDHLRPNDAIGVCGFSWHLPRVKLIARHIDRNWAHDMLTFPVEFPMPAFDRWHEPLKYLKVFVPKRLHQPLMQLVKQVMQRTSC